MHGADLARRSVRAENDRVIPASLGFYKIGILHIARRVPDREIEQLKVVFVALHLTRAVDLEPHITENAIEFTQDLGIGMQAAQREAPSRQGDIQALLLDRALERRLPHLPGPGNKCLFERFFYLICALTDYRPFFL